MLVTTPGKFLRRLLAALVGSGVVIAAGITEQAWADGPSRSGATVEVTLSPDELLEVIRGLVASGRMDQARKLLDQVGPTLADTASVEFLKAVIAEHGGRVEEANQLYRGILTSEPHLVRVRLRLALNLFRAGEDRAARYHFTQALAGGKSVGQNMEASKISSGSWL